VAGPDMIPFLPSYIPPDVDMNQVLADVRDDGVSVPSADAKIAPELRQVVADARENGIDLKIVVIATNPPIDTPLRDIATEVGEEYPGSTVLAMSPTWAGTYSPTFDRATLEAGQDIAKNGDPVQSSKNFVSELTTTHFPWTAFSVVLIVLVLGAAVATRFLQVWSKRNASETESQTAQ
jgi:Family of unknown function (DUF6676)